MTTEFVEDNTPTTTKPKGGRDIGAATAHSSEEDDETGDDIDTEATQPSDEGGETARAV